MPRFAANISTMFGEWDFLDRFAAAADAGFAAVECQWPYAFDPDQVASKLARHNLSMVLINAPAGNRDKGDVGLAAIPGRQEECRAGIDRALIYCRTLECNRVHLLSGCPSERNSVDECRQVLIDNARYATDVFSSHGIEVLFEPINMHDVPRYFLSRTAEAVAVTQQINRANARVQFDLYHAHRMGEDIYETMTKFSEHISHMQISGFPGRHEPDVGDLDYLPLFDAIDRSAYTGWIGCEYSPQAGTLEGLGWAAAYGIRAQ